MAIICVVLIHFIQINESHHDNDALYLTLFPFQMSLFMFLSGFIESTHFVHSLLNYLRKNDSHLLIQFWV